MCRISIYLISSSDEEDAVPVSVEAPKPVKTEAEFVTEDTINAAAEYKRSFKNWVKYRVPWKELYPNLEGFDLIADLMELDVGIVYLHILEKEDPDRSKFGFSLSLLAAATVKLAR